MADDRKAVLLRLELGLFDRVEEARGDVPRQRFLERAVEAAVEPAGAYAFEAERQAVKAAMGAGATSVVVEAGSVVPKVVEGGGQVGDPPPSGRDARPIVPPGGDGKPTIAQLIGWSGGGLTTPSAKRALEDGSWRNYKPKEKRDD